MKAYLRRHFHFEFRWAEHIGRDKGCDYVVRWVLVLFGYGLRLHHWLKDDDQRYYHDHPWWFLSIMLRGGYTDLSPLPGGGEQADHVTAGQWRLRPAKWQHKVRVDPGGAWTLLVTGPKVRNFGFWVPRKDKQGWLRLVRYLDYFHTYGHHQCK